MKITRRKLKNIIKEELDALQEQSFTPSYLIDFAKAYSSLDQTAKDQLEKVLGSWYLGGQGADQARHMISNRQEFSSLGDVLDALSAPIDSLHGSDSKDLQELLGVIRNELSGNTATHPMDDDGDGSVDWDELD